MNQVENMHSSGLRKSKKWYNEKPFRNAMALNKKEESLLQQNLEQLHREESFLRREHDSKIVKTAQALDTFSNNARTIRRKSSPLCTKSHKLEMLQRRRPHSLASLPTAIMNRAAEHDKKEAIKDVMLEIENSFKFLSVAWESKPSFVKLPEIKHGYAPRSDVKAALLRRRHSDITMLRHGIHISNTEARRSSLANTPENLK